MKGRVEFLNLRHFVAKTKYEFGSLAGDGIDTQKNEGNGYCNNKNNYQSRRYNRLVNYLLPLP